MNRSEKGGRIWSDDFLGGLLLIAIAAVVIVNTRELEWTSVMGVGPAYFPGVAALILILLGAILCGGALLGSGAIVDLRHGIFPALFITVSVLLFAGLLQSAGLVVSVFIASLVASFASKEMPSRARLSLSAILSALAALIFYFALSLPMPLWPVWNSN